uniref:Uncharacterized protein n=1 Tax=Amphimedon queenslandica TaxID=400682 RepID=A0A1X7SKT2_AMPQE
MILCNREERTYTTAVLALKWTVRTFFIFMILKISMLHSLLTFLISTLYFFILTFSFSLLFIKMSRHILQFSFPFTSFLLITAVDLQSIDNTKSLFINHNYIFLLFTHRTGSITSFYSLNTRPTEIMSTAAHQMRICQDIKTNWTLYLHMLRKILNKRNLFFTELGHYSYSTRNVM